MRSRGKTFHIVLQLFLAFFTLYAVSPLTYSGNTSNTCQHDQPATHDVSLYLVKLLLMQFSPQEGQKEQDNEPSARYLLKKKRAVLSSNNLKTLEFLQVVEIASHDLSVKANALQWVYHLDCGIAANHQCVCPLHSSNSPPAA